MTNRHGEERARALAATRLYLVAQPPVTLRREELSRFCERIGAAVRGGVGIVQLRAKEAPTRDVVRLAAELKPWLEGALLIVNDDIEAACSSGADGVHLGQGDASVATARAKLGRDALVGVSTHTLGQAKVAASKGADYLGFGAMFDTATKAKIELVGPPALRPVVSSVEIPVFAIGGITCANVDLIVQQGGDRIAVSQAILGARDCESAARELLARLVR